ncbi:hypothetical protein NKL07_08020 [Mesorhizobium sp. C280B]|uniref:hypothetical protein n=1 Tax=unclassified Mesorhizobium TaxID=325217 RepID=UPI0012EC5AD0|nr:hypothetical protein [Mesorhizobium sp. LSJC280B00]
MWKTRSSRWFLLLFIAFNAAALGFWYFSIDYFPPKNWYGYTQGADAGIDIQSPTGKAIMVMEFLPVIGSGTNYELKRYDERCGLEALAKFPGRPLGLTYREVYFCNAAGLSDADFSVASGYFKQTIDGMYSQRYGRMARDVAWLLAVASLAWLACFLLLWAMRWANAPAK